MKRLYLGNLNFSLTDDDAPDLMRVIRAALDEGGLTGWAGIVYSNFPHGFCIIQVDASDDERICDILGRVTYRGRTMRAEAAKNRSKRRPRPVRSDDDAPTNENITEGEPNVEKP